MKAIFMGTPEFALASLETLYESSFEVEMVISQPDRKKDRGKKVLPTPVKARALELGLPVFQPEKIKAEEVINKIKAIAPDIIIVTAYGQILPKAILEIPRLGCVNVHASLLPKYRGAAPINWAIIDGEESTGITTMYMAEGLDTGDMIFRDEINIAQDWNSQDLHDALADLSRITLKKTLESISAGTASRTSQDHQQSTYAKMMTKSLGEICWRRPAKAIHDLIRGTYPWPGAYTHYREQVMKVITAELTAESSGQMPGTIERVSSDGIYVATADRLLKITTLQMPGKRKIPVEDYLKGNSIAEKEVLI